MASRDSDASLYVERNDRRSMKRSLHWLVLPLLTTFCHFNGKTIQGSSFFSFLLQALRSFFAAAAFLKYYCMFSYVYGFESKSILNRKANFGQCHNRRTHDRQ